MTCTHNNVANLDHRKGYPPDTVLMVNRICLSCGAHWYSQEGSAKEYTRAEWDAYVNAAFDEVAT